MKKISLRLRFTLTASVFLFVSCTVLAFLSNFSANKMVEAIELQPSVAVQEGDVLFFPLEEIQPAIATEAQKSYHVFRTESIVATICIVTVGSLATYFASGYVLKPIRTLSQEVEKRNATNLEKQIPIPQSADEIQQLTVSFNHMLKQLQHAFELQKQFSADAAHELRTPLAVMQAKLDVFSMSEQRLEDVDSLVASMNQQLDRLNALIEELLWFSRDLPLEERRDVPLDLLISDVAEELSCVAEEKQISLTLDGENCVVQGQDNLLERVFYNLIENAIKYSAPSSHVSIRTKHQEKHILVDVIDEGEGIPPEYRELVFEPFFRIDKSRSRLVGGSGLGLAVCKKILERHGASISVLEHQGGGSIFRVIFPS